MYVLNIRSARGNVLFSRYYSVMEYIIIIIIIKRCIRISVNIM